jgi:hypothetical protein
MKSIEDLTEQVLQCTQCKSEGEIMIDQDRMKSIKIERHLLTVKHIKHLEEEISKLMKQKAELQDQVDRYVDKEMKNDTKTG